jgi:16S rRNA A1518/A1519 N6-dimethyltransferase RsmA/KsgA/DIM1 with predicted DNA glycosylase/AP lyase activity
MEQTPKEQSIFVGNFPYSTSAEQLAKLLEIEEYGSLTLDLRFELSRSLVDPEAMHLLMSIKKL